MWFQVGEQFLDAGGRYSDIWHRRVGTGQDLDGWMVWKR